MKIRLVPVYDAPDPSHVYRKTLDTILHAAARQLHRDKSDYAAMTEIELCGSTFAEVLSEIRLMAQNMEATQEALTYCDDLHAWLDNLPTFDVVLPEVDGFTVEDLVAANSSEE